MWQVEVIMLAGLFIIVLLGLFCNFNKEVIFMRESEMLKYMELSAICRAGCRDSNRIMELIDEIGSDKASVLMSRECEIRLMPEYRYEHD